MSPSANRREFLLSSVAAVSAATFGIPLSQLSAAQAAAAAAPDLTAYAPEFFSGPEMKFISAVCDRLIPANADGPGALDTNVPVFIDQQLRRDYGADWYLQGPFEPHADPLMGYQLPYTPQDIYRTGIRVANAYSQKLHQKDFAELSAADKDAVLTDLEKNKVKFSDFGEENLTASAFFGQVLADTKDGYLSDPMYGGNKGMEAWKMIGFPGARASYLEWVTQHNVKYPLGPVSVRGERA
jgi:gluconate 2-dehydrogenase gamma chain